MAHFAKPSAGSWTQQYPELGTSPVDYTDSIDPAFYEKERAAIFKRTWLNVGRVERLPRTGSYFTKELAAAGTSLVIVKGGDGTIRAFHNVCRHRGNKLVWNDFPGEETAGSCRQFICKYHAWRYDLTGKLTFVQQEDEFFDLDKADYGLKDVACDVWEGFIFINLDPQETLTEYLGDMATSLAGYPFGEMTEVYSYRSEVGSNWKLFIDAFAEFYHAPVLHQKQAVKDEAEKLIGFGYEALHYDLSTSPHSMISSWGGMSPPKDPAMVKPIERVLRSGLFGPWDKPAIDGLNADSLPPGLNPARHRAWGSDSFEFFPNFTLLIWEPGWYLTYHYWPTAVDKHIFESSLYFVPPTNTRQRLAQELAAVTFKEYALQDANTLEATQTMIATRTVTEFPLNDQEILLRHLHKVVGDRVKEYTDATTH